MKNNNKTQTDPFTRTPGIAGKAFINMHYSEKIIESFSDPESDKYIYKIVGLRGSGKSVEYGKVMQEFRGRKGWLVYSLSAAGNQTETLIAKLSKEPFIDANDYSTSVSGSAELSGNALLAQGAVETSITKSTSPNKDYYSPEADLDEMLSKAREKGYKVLIGIDDISRTESVVKFLSIIGKQYLDGNRSLYFLCTGLAQNIEDFSNDSNITFFKRSDKIETTALDKFEINDKYREFLNVTEDKAVELAKMVKGYAYAYQVLGSLYFNRTNETDEELIYKFEKILFQDSYDLIWKTLTPAEKSLVRNILNTPTGEVKDIKSQMENEQNFPVLRARLINKHLLTAPERGVLTIELPRFKEYVDRWGD